MNISLANSTFNESDLEQEFVFNRGVEELASRIFLELFTILSFICIAFNIIISFVILRYRRLREEKSNIILLHWAIINSLFMLSTPTNYRFMHDFSDAIDYLSVYCIVEQFEHTFLLADILLITFLVIYWYLRLYYPSKFQNIVKYFVIYIGCLYVLCVIILALEIHSCNNNIFGLAQITLFLSYLLFFLFMVIMNIIHAVRKKSLPHNSNKRNLPFVLSNTFFVCYIPIVVSLFLGLLIEFNYIVLLATIYTTFFISIMTPVYFFMILYKYDDDFHTFFRHVLTCKCRQYQEEFQEHQVIYNNDVNVDENKC
ncbi:uncharacterized protein isoform X2 [Leptinotarsa decemlineata]|uniref:uncharacterized protein isoform X2 n=1 Tax=Leptinotarsa decemlineata TaxID=7539 RepID=UPI003D309307